MDYSFQKIEPKWQAKWEEEGIFHAEDFSEKPTRFNCSENFAMFLSVISRGCVLVLIA